MTSPGPLRFVIASANSHKAAEIREILGNLLVDGVELIDRPSAIPEVEETGTTLLQNARLKAVALSKATGCAAIADDTGLEVAALDGAPGVYSARYAGPEADYRANVEKLLGEIGAASDRRAQFTTIAVAVFPNGDELIGEGAVHGSIAMAVHGENGFGYDPIFVPNDGDGRTFAQMSSEEKHALSHRGRALRSLAREIAAHRG